MRAMESRAGKVRHGMAWHKAWQSNRRNSRTFSEYDGEIGVVC
jgi:hypothetical protein